MTWFTVAIICTAISFALAATAVVAEYATWRDDDDQTLEPVPAPGPKRSHEAAEQERLASLERFLSPDTRPKAAS
jgi:hypothetical protein